jgi:hypothetical protein
LPAVSQWEVVQRAAGWLAAAYVDLVRQAAQGEVLYNDDTTMKIFGLSAPGDHEPQEPQDEQETTRTGVFTSGIVSTSQGEKIALFFTGRQHAGESLAQVLAQRAAELAAPIQMCDALSRNSQDALDTVLAHCIAHARRCFVEVAASFSDDCRHVLETLGEVYHNDAETRQRELSKFRLVSAPRASNLIVPGSAYAHESKTLTPPPGGLYLEQSYSTERGTNFARNESEIASKKRFKKAATCPLPALLLLAFAGHPAVHPC